MGQSWGIDMVASMSTPRLDRPTAGRSKVLAWALWDCGSTGMNAIVATFVFSVYLTGSVGQGLPGVHHQPAGWAHPHHRGFGGRGLGAGHRCPGSGSAPAAHGVDGADGAGSLVDQRDVFHPRRCRLPGAGLALLALTAACGDLASVPYNAMLRQLTTPQNSGRVSGLGWAAGYFGSVCCCSSRTSDSSSATDLPVACWGFRWTTVKTSGWRC